MLTKLARILDALRRLGTSRSGNSAVEFATAAPILMMMAFGAFDYGRAYVEEVRLSGAARAGAQYALYEPTNWTDSDAMEQTALEEYTGHALTDAQMASLPITAAANSYCACTKGAAVSVNCSNTCPDGSDPGRFVRVALTGAVPLTLPYPWSSNGEAQVGGEAVVRVH